MSCGCRQSGPETARLLSHLESIGWRPIAETAVVELRDVVTRSQEHRDRAATATALGLPAAVAQRHQALADRFAGQAADISAQMTTQLRERVGSADWRDLDGRLARVLTTNEAATAFRSLREACVDLLYDAGASADVAAATLEAIDEAVTATRGGLPALARHVETQTQQALQALTAAPGADPRAARRRLKAATILCIILAVGAGAIPSIIACLASGPAAPACIAVVVGVAATIVVLGCLRI
jgi:hypothetical protein